MLDLTRPGGMTLEEVGAVYHVTRERIRQIQSKACRKIKKHAQVHGEEGEYRELLNLLAKNRDDLDGKS